MGRLWGWQWPVFPLVTYNTHVLGLPRRRPGPWGNLTRSRCQHWCPQTCPPHPARVEAVGTSAVAPCPGRAVRPWLALLPRREQLGRLSADVRPRRGWEAPGTPAGLPALNGTGKPARDPTRLPAGSSVDRRAVGWTPSCGRAWGQSVRTPGTRGSEMRHVSIQMLDWKPSPSTWSRAPQDGPTTAPNRGARSRKSSFRKMCLKSFSNENPRSEGHGGHWRPDHGWQ